MKKAGFLSSVILVLMLTLLPLGAAGCGTNLESLLLEILEEWADEHDINPTTPGGAANLAKRAASGSTGDEQADAAIGLGKMVSDIREGDIWMDKGKELRASGNLTGAADSMDAAIETRPNDWSYRVSRAALYYQNPEGSPGTLGYAHMQQAWGAAGYRAEWNDELEHNEYVIAPEYNKTDVIRFHTQTIDELESSAINVAGMPAQTAIYYYAELAEAYERRAELTGSEQDAEMAEQYRERTGGFRVLD